VNLGNSPDEGPRPPCAGKPRMASSHARTDLSGWRMATNHSQPPTSSYPFATAP
jgi:hypothetical protein